MLSNGVVVKRGQVVVSCAACGDNKHSIITLENGMRATIDNIYLTTMKPLTFVDAYGEPEMGPGNQQDSIHVLNLQYDLSSLGYYDGPFDGIYGENTMKAVSDFREDEGIGRGYYAGPRVKKQLFAKMYQQYDRLQDREIMQFWNGYNTYRQEIKEVLLE